MARRAVVFYEVGASDLEKRRALFDGLRECVSELIELGAATETITSELEQLGSDVETDSVL